MAETLKEDLQEDLPVFVEVDEFGEMTTIDGVTLPAQVIIHTVKKSGIEARNFDGLHGDFVTVYFKTADYTATKERIPRQGEWCIINSKRYDVMSSQDELGITKLECAAYRQNTLRGL